MNVGMFSDLLVDEVEVILREYSRLSGMLCSHSMTQLGAC